MQQKEGSVWLRVPLSPAQPQSDDIDLLNVQAFSTVSLRVFKVYGHQIEPVTIHYNSHLNNYLFNLSGSDQSGYLFINTEAYNVRTLYLNTGSASQLLKRLETLNFHSGWFFCAIHYYRNSQFHRLAENQRT